MYVSGKTVSYRLLPLFLLLTSFLISLSDAIVVQYACLKRKNVPSIEIGIELGNGESLTDIYAKGKKTTCSLSGGKITGLGTNPKPYKLEVGAADITNCGVVVNGQIQTMTLMLQDGTFVSSSGKTADIKCDFSKVDTSANMEPTVNFAAALQATELKASVKMAFDNSKTTVVVGDDVKLKITLNDPQFLFQRMEPFKCWAMRSSTDKNGQLILDNYCSVTGAPAKIEFSPTNSRTATSKTFKIFRFFDSDKLYIKCIVDICLFKEYCTKPTCTGKKKRSAFERNWPTHLVRTNTSILVKGKGSSNLFSNTQLPYTGTLFPVSLFVIVILSATVVGLVLTRRKNRRKTEEYQSAAREELEETEGSI